MRKGMDENGFFSENKSGKRSHDTRPNIFNKMMGSIDRELNSKKAAEAAAERKLSQGNGKFIKAGSDDRVNGSVYMPEHIYEGKIVTHDDEMSYFYGYTTHGGKRLLAVVEELIKEEKYDEIAQIAERDYSHGIEEHRLGMVANNSIYLDAYHKAASKGKTR